MSGTKWTKEQQSVIDSRNGNLLVAAAAGSGKTAVLVERIIKMIIDKENPVDINRLLVVTFTNAAAAEMKERVQIAIEKLIQESEASELLKRQLVLLNDAKITTIHSFCLNVIENYYYKIPIQPNFRIASEQECDLLKIRALNDTFEKLYQDNNSDFISLLKCYGSNRDDTTLRELIMDMYKFVIASPTPFQWLDESVENLQVNDDFNFLETNYGKSLLNTISIILEGVEQSYELIINQTHDIPELNSYHIRYLSEYDKIKIIRTKLNEGWDDIRDTINSITYENYQKGMKKIPKDADEYIKELKNTTKALRDDCKDTIKNLYEDLFYRTQQDIVEEFQLLYPTLKTISRICKDFISNYQRIKKEALIIDFNDIEHFALKVLTKEDENGNLLPSDVAEEYCELFDEIFIDEYQDSSLTQEVILKSISKNYNNRFMVGDVKQSIYKFRQARPDIFLEKYNNYSTDKNEYGKKILLHKNFRSRKEILDATNYIFEHIMSEELGGLEYGESERLNLGGNFNPPKSKINHGGAAELHLIQKNDEHDEDNDVTDEEDLDKMQLEAKVISGLIKEITNPNSDKALYVIDKRSGEYRLTNYGDIVILLRSTANWEEVITNELLTSNIPISSESSSNYFDNYEVKVIVSILKTINNVLDDIALTGALRTPIFNYTIDELISIRANNKKIKIYNAMKLYIEKNNNELASKCKNTLDTLHRYIDKFRSNSLEKTLESLYNETNIYLFVQALPNGDIRKRNLDLLLERIKNFETNNSSELVDFINYINNLIENNIELPSALNSSNNENAVKIMTIHKSKGLEFPVVICAGLGKGFNNLDLRNTMLKHSDLGYGPQIFNYERGITYPSIMKESIKSKMLIENLSEEMRVLYVALTRPKEKLYLVGTIDNIEKSMNKWSGYTKEDSKIPKYAILKSNNYLDWIVPAILKHPNMYEVRNLYNLTEIPLSIHESKWKCHLWKPQDISKLENIVDITNTTEGTKKEDTLDLKSIFKSIKPVNLKDTYIPEKISVTSTVHNIETKTISKPLFIKSNDRNTITGIDRGRLVHEFLYRVNFNHTQSEEEIKIQLANFIKKGFFTREEANMIPVSKIYTFFTSDLGKRLLKSKRVKREQEISSYLSADKITGKSEDANSLVMIKGIIDLYFEEDEDIVLIDYKTDDTSKQDFEEVIKQYKKQVLLYKEILENITHKTVKESYLYLFSTNKYITVSF